jgi:hypothetical protein
MTNRDRLVLISLSALAVLGAVWLLVVSPERKQAVSLKAQVDSASTQLATAEGQLTGARAAQARYASAYSSIVSLGKAVPASEEVPSLIYQLAQASNQKSVDFASISTGGSASSSSAASAAATPAAGAGFTQMPFTFVFNGSFSDLYHLFQQLNRFTTRTTAGGLQVSGRLLTIQSAKLAPSGAAGVSGKPSTQLTGTITATAYVLPATQGLTGGATAVAPAAPGAAASTTPASSSGTASSAAAPAIARVIR